MSEYDTVDPWSLDAVLDRAEAKPPRMVFYGPHGVGKSTLLANFPGHLALFTEDGKRNLKIRHFPQVATTYDDVTRAIGAVLRNPAGIQAFGLDSLDWLEPLIWAETCARHRIETIESPGYGKGYLLADEVWAELLEGLNAVRDAGIAVVLLAHSEVTMFSPPDSDPYSRYDLALHKRARAMIHEWADVVGFCYEKALTIQKTEGAGKSAKTITRGGGIVGRYVALTRKTTHEAKNGYGLPDELPLSSDSTTADSLMAMIATSFEA
jgi:hypothetical protein